ncbi:4-(cytidine 5'-diphospho)-2-C-methyl-D-erythritol kinase [Hyphomonas sp.]|uniref:4-(cytidine 5'-diphospho)-2-C-methyl-D-erythritol kinase n=1 Tax=Hyphomonas sp. TaxID=87 RepID=UPI00391CDD7D
MLRAHAPAKVNLFLHVGPVKPNGRHDLDSLVVFADEGAADRLSVTASDTLGLEVEGPGAREAGPAGENLVLRAASALKEASGTQQGAFFRLRKALPVAAGIGGGSSDAAAALRLLTELWNLDPAMAEAVAPGLGGDVPVALAGVAARMQGEGERVTRAALPGRWRLPALLVNPGVACPTGPVFRAYDEAGGGADFAELPHLPEFGTLEELTVWLGTQRNDLEAPALKLVPEIGEVLDWLGLQPGVRLVRMSGSGATCFALFDKLVIARDLEARFRRDWPKGWAAACTLGDALI